MHKQLEIDTPSTATGTGTRAPRVLMAATIGISVRGGLVPFAKHFRAQGWHVDAMANGIDAFPECGETFNRVWNVSWSRNPLAPVNLTRALKEVQQAVAQGEYDIVHVHTPVAGFLLRYALRKVGGKRPKVIYTAHGFHFLPGAGAIRNAIFRTLEQLAAPWTDYLVVINHTDETACSEYGILPRHELLYMPGIGIDTRRFSRASVPSAAVLAAREGLGIPSEGKLFLMVAEFNPGKRHIDLLHALKHLDRPDVFLLFAGAGKLMHQMRTLADQLGLTDRVRFLGFRPDIPALMRAADAVVLPSDREGLPLCILEAMSLEVPVIATDVRGSADLVKDGFGYLVPLGEPTALAAAMEQVLLNPEEARTRAAKAAARMSQFDIENIKAFHQELYAKALAC